MIKYANFTLGSSNAEYDWSMMNKMKHSERKKKTTNKHVICVCQTSYKNTCIYLSLILF